MSESNKKSATSGGIGLGGAIFIVFLILKLAEIGQVKDWSWWWVTSPLWIPLGLFIVIIGSLFIVGFVLDRISDIAKSTSKKTKEPPKSGFQKRLEEMAKQRNIRDN